MNSVTAKQVTKQVFDLTENKTSIWENTFMVTSMAHPYLRLDGAVLLQISAPYNMAGLIMSYTV